MIPSLHLFLPNDELDDLPVVRLTRVSCVSRCILGTETGLPLAYRSSAGLLAEVANSREWL